MACIEKTGMDAGAVLQLGRGVIMDYDANEMGIDYPITEGYDEELIRRVYLESLRNTQ